MAVGVIVFLFIALAIVAWINQPVKGLHYDQSVNTQPVIKVAGVPTDSSAKELPGTHHTMSQLPAGMVWRSESQAFLNRLCEDQVYELAPGNDVIDLHSN
jgi:hypothetical protein